MKNSAEAVALRVAACDLAANHPVIDAKDSTGLKRNQKLLRAAVRYAGSMTKKRGYTYDFTPKSEKHGRYLLDKIPADLWRRVKAKSKRDGVSIRAFLLKGLTEWVDIETR